ncbi:MAG: hypothetical protein NTV93_12910 [Verrucomicrobia bacterium]|nr:hypothetical protein [Verrucomicrobiota bacterium]
MKLISQTHSASTGNILSDFRDTDFRNSVVGYEISRFEVENGLSDRLVHDLRIDPTNPLIHAGPGMVVFLVSGFDDDPREIYDIPQFVEFIRRANESSPCWMYFAAPESYWLHTVAFCVTKSAYVSGSRPGFRTLAFSPYEAAGFLDSQLDDCCELSIIAGVSEKSSRKHLKLVFGCFGIDLP